MRRARYNIYVIELDPDVLEVSRFREANPDYVDGMNCLYVGQTAVTPEERFQQHKGGYKANRYAKRYGMKLRRDLYERYNPIAGRDRAERMEESIARRLRARGYAVWYN